MSFPWAQQYAPKNSFMRYVDEKLPLPRFVYNAVGAGYPVPRNLNYFWNFGVLAGVCLVIQILTGVILAMHFAPNAAIASISARSPIIRGWERFFPTLCAARRRSKCRCPWLGKISAKFATVK